MSDQYEHLKEEVETKDDDERRIIYSRIRKASQLWGKDDNENIRDDQ